jgi:hypothetical protein
MLLAGVTVADGAATAAPDRDPSPRFGHGSARILAYAMPSGASASSHTLVA